MPPNIYPTSTQRLPKHLPDIILRRSFTRSSTALGDWRPGNEATNGALTMILASFPGPLNRPGNEATMINVIDIV